MAYVFAKEKPNSEPLKTWPNVYCIYIFFKNKAIYTTASVAYGWAGALMDKQIEHKVNFLVTLDKFFFGTRYGTEEYQSN